jgi:hypothetical protein
MAPQDPANAWQTELSERAAPELPLNQIRQGPVREVFENFEIGSSIQGKRERQLLREQGLAERYTRPARRG